MNLTRDPSRVQADSSTLAGLESLLAPNLFHERLRYGSDLWPLAVGQLVEISGKGGGAGLSFAASFVRHAQSLSKPCLWLSSCSKPFYPPDMANSGVDLGKLPLLFLPTPQDASLASARLLSSGGFDLLVWDLASWKSPPLTLETSLLARLNALTRHHRSTLVILTDKTEQHPSLGCLIGLRLKVEAFPRDPARLQIQVVKDKRGAVGEGKIWSWRCEPPEGLPASAPFPGQETLRSGRNSKNGT